MKKLANFASIRLVLPLLILVSVAWHPLAGQDPTASSPLKLASWNIQDFGRSKNKQEIRQMAEYLRNFDLVAIQEVVANNTSGPKAVARLVDELDRMGANWDYRISDPTDSPPYKTERYAFLWRTDRVKNIGRPWLEASLPEAVYREPYMGRFESEGLRFLLVNFHARRGADKPEEEIPFLADLIYAYPSDLLVFLGDFNLETSHPAFDDLETEGYRSALENQLTSLRQSCDSLYFSASYDHIFLPSAFLSSSSGIIDIVGHCDNLQQARKLSDHVPVWVVIEN
jgi:endonuclease/exonuclease/phosphatase family metal-dependent hydrolase